jgi:hypothetical protein
MERDLLDCGVPIGDVRALVNRYARALETGACVDWIELYVGIFATLMRNSNRTRVADSSAARRLLLLLDDDLGSKIFDRDARMQLALALNGYAGLEYSGRACQGA